MIILSFENTKCHLILFHQGSYKDKFRKCFPYIKMCLRRFQKIGVTNLFFEKKNGQGKLKKYTCFYGGAKLWHKL